MYLFVAIYNSIFILFSTLLLEYFQLSARHFETLVFIIFSVTQAQCLAPLLNCSKPSSPALLEALSPVFQLRFIRPVSSITTYTDVNISFTLYGILGVDEKAQILTTYIWQQVVFKNEFISWDPEQCGTDEISLPRSQFWVPDLVINEFMAENTAPSVPYVHVHSNGMIHDSSPVRVVSSCNLNIYTFPFDVQNCTFTFNSYIHSTKDIRINLEIPAETILKTSREVMSTVGEWQLMNITTHKHILHGPEIDELKFHIQLRRSSTLYVVNLLIPSGFLITVDLFSFMLPPQSVDRSAFKMTLILGYTVFLLLMNDLLPVTGNTIPLINVFFSICLALMVTSLLETILITNLHSGSSHFAPVPHWVKVVVLNTLGCLVGLPPKPPKDNSTDVDSNAVKEESKVGKNPPMAVELEDTTLDELRRLGRDLRAIRLQVDQQMTGNQNSEEWMQVAFIIDRFLFWLYTLFISVSCITMIYLWAQCLAPLLNCSKPSPPALLQALSPVFDLRFIRPVSNITTYTDVHISFILYGILGVEWKNEFISWDPEQCGTVEISLPRSQFWVPDLVINEFMAKNTAPSVPYVHVLSDGMIRDSSPVRVVSSCNLNIYTFPFDVQNCTFTFNSYIHTKKDIRVNLHYSIQDILNASFKVISTVGEWELMDITAEKEPPFEFDELKFHIALRRKPTLYVVNLIIPSCFLITVDLFSFMLPPQSVDRSSFKMTLILGYTVFLLLMNELLPVTGNTIPLINVFFSICLALMVASLLETILITNLHSSSSHFAPVPHWVKVVVLNTLGCLVGFPLKPAKDNLTDVAPNAVKEENKVGKNPPMAVELEDTTLDELRKLGRDLRAIRLQVDQQMTENQNSEEWMQVAFIIDRFLFWLYTLFISVSCITMIYLWVNSYRL
ncbi:5-hydroxytryptamine receptor 3E [Merluccius polli]|uniref:5-hydroxytryptamine receptor 3E n=1 Tax=Merluccius polli TaxID=89951 RepID=A0AA47MAL0_MERPO|nr:5-hydroxytryptamine receptor 3E [Merluccius polli]